MRITDLLQTESIALNSHPAQKEEAIEQAVALMAASGHLSDVSAFREAVFIREEQGTTGVGDGIAIPHGKTQAVSTPGLSAMVIPDGVDFDALDGAPVTLLFLIAAPDTKENVHLAVLSRLSTLLMDETFTQHLRQAKTVDEFLHYIDEAEAAKFEEARPQEQTNEYQILAVTACPTGIAHTYMAAESLESKAKARGISIKVETNGSGGAKNVLTDDEIARADCIIIAADKNVEMARFDGKPLIQAKVADGIHKADALLTEALNGHAAVYHHNSDTGDAPANVEKEGVGHTIYKHLMNGVSHMLPFVIGGGILIALAFLLDDYALSPAQFGSNTPVAAFFKSVGDAAFGFMLPILAGYIAMSIADRPGLAVGFIGGYIAKMGMTFTNPAGGAFTSGFLGALLAGFIGGYLIVGLRKLFDRLPHSLEGIKPVLLYPVCGILLMGVIMFAINPVVGAINNALNQTLLSMNGASKIVLGLVLGGMMSVDMGGPVNKAAYVFGTAQLAAGEYGIMAAVMAGGMVAPLAIAICATFFRNRFSKKERQSALVNYVMGASFISEGAIPFAAQDPLRVLPACIIGSAIAGGLSMAFGCGLRAPHGGIFVLPVVSNPFGYLAAIMIGSVVGALLLAVLKKPVHE